jgi:hypothetical protein
VERRLAKKSLLLRMRVQPFALSAAQEQGAKRVHVGWVFKVGDPVSGAAGSH